MTGLSRLCAPLALFVALASARAQHQDGGTGTAAAPPHTASASHGARSAPAHTASGGAWTGTASQWGGSPPPVRSREHASNPVGRYIYVPVIVVAVPPAPAPPDTAAAGYDPAAPGYDPAVAGYRAAAAGGSAGVTEMRVITTRTSHEPTTMDVYRQQRFARP